MNTFRTNSAQIISLFRYPFQSSTLALPKALLISAMATTAEAPGENLPNLSSPAENGEAESSPAVASSPAPPPAEAPPSAEAQEVEDEDVKFGFKRSEMYKESLPVKISPYYRHVFLAFKSALSWPARVEDVAYDPLPGRFAKAIKNRKDEMPRLTLFTVIEGGAESGVSDGDVLIFPDMIKYKNLTQEAVDDFVEDILIKDATSTKFGSPEKLTGSHVFVCAHTSRDKRCGVCGPVLIDKLKAEIKLRDLNVSVSPCSHIGGHKYAGNVIVFGANSEGKVMGHWYGYVTPDDVPLLLEQHIGKGEIVEHLWRGEVCHPYESKIQESKLEPQESDGVAYLNGMNNGNNVEESLESTTKGNIQNGGSCCQGDSGFTCCRDAKVDLDVNATDSKPSKNGVCAKGMGKISSWVGKLEQADVLLGVGVIGAVATVAVAYSIYRRSG